MFTFSRAAAFNCNRSTGLCVCARERAGAFDPVMLTSTPFQTFERLCRNIAFDKSHLPTEIDRCFITFSAKLDQVFRMLLLPSKLSPDPQFSLL
jgi:hypothetical protein